MAYLQFSGQNLFDGTQFLGPDQVLITTAEGIIKAIIPLKDAGENVQKLNGIITPGFINAHCHLELSHMKGIIPEHTGLPDFILKIVNERHFPEENMLEAIAQAEAAMLQEGIVAVGDISNNALTAPQKQQGNLAYHTFVEISGWKPAIAEPRFANALEVLSKFRLIEAAASLNPLKNLSNPLKSSFSPHAPYSVSGELWQMMIPYFEGHTVTIHNQETPAENELFIKGTGDFVRMYQAMNIDQTHFSPTGQNSLPSYFPQLKNAKKILLVHNTTTSEADMDYANQLAMQHSQELYYTLCVNANLYIENQLPPIESLRSKNAAIVLGTDSLSSNHQLSILAELKTLTKNFPAIPLAEMLKWATLNGAKALQMESQFGSFEKGKKPGVILISQLKNNQISDQSTVNRLV
jgi:cytosine/adenosine deaminase-related metal-dependent hydrolase